jgi:hypothetical protein
LCNGGRLIKHASLDTLNFNNDWAGGDVSSSPTTASAETGFTTGVGVSTASTGWGGDASRPASTYDSVDASSLGSSRAAGPAWATSSVFAAAAEAKPSKRSYSCSAF